MAIVAVDLFCGCGGTSTGLYNACHTIGKQVDLLAINHWPVAIATHQANHPGARHICARLESIRPEDEIPGGRVNILVASPECFPAGTLILAERGLIPIENIKKGDVVLTHKGRWRPVTSVMSHLADTLIVKGQGHPGLEVTSNHPFLARRQSRKWNNDIRQYDRSFGEPEWIEAKKLCTTTVRWATPNAMFHRGVPEVPGRGMSINNRDFWWLIGRWLGDGTVRIREGQGSEICIVAGDHEVDELDRILAAWMPNGKTRAAKDELRWRKRRTRTAWLFECAHKGLVDWLVEHFGRLAHGKTIPAWALTLYRGYREALLEGYLSADGHKGQRVTFASTVSKRLAIGIRLLAESLGYRANLYHRKQHCRVIEGRQLNVRDLWRVQWESNASQRTAYADNGVSWSLVKRIQPGRRSVQVFNLSVEEDESYIADGIVVHNCTHHSVARGGKPVNDQLRSSAWLVLRWLESLRVDNMLIENVREFRDWGPVGASGKPLKSRKGETYQAWINAIRSFGYTVEDRVLNAADYGDPTTRQRLFVLARKGKRPIRWPDPTHGEPGNLYGLQPYRTAREIIDWTIKGESIFERKRPLAPATLARIAAGLKKYGGANAKPFLVILYGTNDARDVDRPMPTITGGGNHTGLCEPFMVTITHEGNDGNRAHSIDRPVPTITGAHRGEMALIEPFLLGQQSCSAPRDVDQPVPTIATAGAISLVEPFLVPFFGENKGQKPRNHSINEPLPTVTSHGAGALVEPFLIKYYGAGEGVSSTDDPVPTITTKDRFGLVEVSGKYQIDIRFRMLQPHELAAAMSFENYTFTGTKTQQTKQIGNAVPVRLAQALCTSLMRN